MTVERVDVLVEEPSMEAALRLLLPKILGQTSFEVYQYRCKQELLLRLPERLAGYHTWLPENWRLVVVVDRDQDACQALKKKLDEIAQRAGLITRTQARAKKSTSYHLVNRIAIEELEAWFFGDWEAVRAAYPRVPPNISTQTKYRQSDAITGGTWEAFERVLRNAGYFETGLRKIEAARAVATHMDPSRNTSPSFRVFCDALREFASL